MSEVAVNVVTWPLAFVVMISVLVVIHELGHWLVAQLLGIGTPTFSVGIGPPLFRLFRWRGTDFVISGLPLGGYVKLAGSDPFGDEDPDAFVDPRADFMKRPIWQRLLVMLAGPVMNLALPFVLFTAVLMFGEPQPDNSVGTVIPGSPAADLGIEPLDRVVAAAGEPVDVWPDLVRVLDDHLGQPVSLTFERAGRTYDVALPEGVVRLTSEGLVDTEAIGLFQSRRSARIGVSDPTSPAWRAGLRPGDGITAVDGAPVRTFEDVLAALTPDRAHALVRVRAVDGKPESAEVSLPPDPSWQPDANHAGLPDPDPNPWGLVHASLFVGSILDGSAASVAGVQVGDRFVSIDGTPVRAWSNLVSLVRRTAIDETATEEDSEGKPLTLVVLRDGDLVTMTFRPRVKRDLVAGVVTFRPVMGVSQFSESYVAGPEVEKYYALPQAFARATEETTLVFERSVGMLGMLVVGKMKVKEGLGGPIAIFQAAGESAERGVFTFVRLMGMISVSLGIFNLLPVPILDGGHIAIYGIEAIRGRPLSVRMRERIQIAGFLALATLVLMVSVFDVKRFIEG